MKKIKNYFKKTGVCNLISAVLLFVLIGYYGRIGIYPCKSSPVIAEPDYEWKLCSADLLYRTNWVGVDEKYFGFDNGKILAYGLNFAIAWLIAWAGSLAYKRCRK